MRLHLSMLVFLALPVAAQTPPSLPHASAAAAQLMSAGAQANGLLGAAMHPWHLRASLDLLDAKGKVTAHATVDELWAGADQSRVVYSVGSQTLSVFRTASGFVSTGAAPAALGDGFDAAELVRQQLVEPLPDSATLATLRFADEERKLAAVTIRCSGLLPPETAGSTEPFLAATGPEATPGAAVSYCYDPKAPALVITATGHGRVQILRGEIVSFAGRYLPRTLRVVEGGRTIVNAHLDVVEALNPVNLAALTPDSGVAAQPWMPTFHSELGVDPRIVTVYPAYPLIVASHKIEGTVRFTVRVGNDGHVSEAHYLDGPTMLMDAAAKAVPHWLYLPYHFNGQVTGATTVADVVFSLGAMGKDQGDDMERRGAADSD